MKASIIAVTLIATFLTGCATAPAPQASRSIEWQPHQFEAASATVGAELGTLRVPQNRSNPGGPELTLKFVRFRSTNPRPGSPIVYLAGGPGGSGIDAAKGSRFPLFEALREYADVIALDQRGTGASEPSLACTENYAFPLDAPPSRTDVTPLSAAVKACADRWRAAGVDLQGFNTRESAADLEDLRKALGAPRLTLWAISYGTHLALAAAMERPHAIDRLILAGVEPLDHTYKLPSDQQKLIEVISARAAGDPAIRAVLPDLAASLGRLVNRLEKEPVTVRVGHPLARAEVAITLGAHDLQYAVASMLADPDSFSGLADLVARLEGGDWTALALAAGRSRVGRAPSVMSIAMDCASGMSTHWSERVRKEARDSILGDSINYPFPSICEATGVADLGDAFRTHKRIDVPTLFISGTLDGRTPPSNAERIMPFLPRSSHLVLDGAGHSDPLFLSSPEILDTMKRFVRGEKLESRRVSVPVTPLYPPRKPVGLPVEALRALEGEYDQGNGQKRVIFLAGPTLYSVRGSNAPLALRPMSGDEFFFEGLDATLKVERDAAGSVQAVVVTQRGTSTRAKKL